MKPQKSRCLGALASDVILGKTGNPWGVWMPVMLNVEVGERLLLKGGEEYEISQILNVSEPARDMVQCRIKPAGIKLPAEEKAMTKQWINLKIDESGVSLTDREGKSIPAAGVDIELRPAELPKVTVKMETLCLDVETYATFDFTDEALAELAARAGYKLEPIDVNLETELGEDSVQETSPERKGIHSCQIDLRRAMQDEGYDQKFPSDPKRDRGGDGIHGRYRKEQPGKVITDQIAGSSPVRENRRLLRKGGPPPHLRKLRK